MPKFNEFIKGFEEKEAEQPKENRDQIIEKINQKMMNAGTYGAFGDKENYEKSIAEAEELRKGLAPKAEEPKEKGTTQTPSNTFKPLSKAEVEDMKKGGFTEDEYRYNQAKDYAIAMGEEMPDKRKFMQELGEWKEANKQKAQPAPQKQEEPSSLDYEGYRLEQTPDGKWINRDTYEYFDSKVEAQKDIDNYIAKNSPKGTPQQKSEFNPSEPIEEYNDSYGAMTHSEREFNVETANDYKMYSYVKKNLPTLKKLAETNPEGVIRAITSHGNYPRSFYGIEPKNIRKEYVQAVLNGFLED